MQKKRWLSLLVENDVGVLARISGLFSGKSYNLESLTVGVTEDSSVSRMTIGLISDDQTFEQIQKQLNRCVEVMKVVDFTDAAIHLKEVLFVKIRGCTGHELAKRITGKEWPHVKILDCSAAAVLLESVQTEAQNNDLIRCLKRDFPGRLEIVRGGSTAVEALRPPSQ